MKRHINPDNKGTFLLLILEESGCAVSARVLDLGRRR
jgi:hypothetical protein